MMIDEHGARVFAVDDEPAITALLQRLITDMSYLVASPRNVHGLTLLRRTRGECDEGA